MVVRFMTKFIAVLGLALGVSVATPLTAPSQAASKESPITIGYVAPETGALSAGSTNSQDGAEAFIKAINEQGGYKGHPLQLVNEDDMSGPAGAEAAINLLVSKSVFAIISNSDFFFTDDRPVEQAGIPVFGGVTDGPEYGEQPFTNMFDIRGDVNSNHEGLQVQSVPLFKSLDAKDVAGLALSISPSSIKTVEDFKTALQDQGLQMSYENLTVPYGPFDPTADVLQMKNAAGVDGMVCSCGTSTFLEFLSTMRAEGLTNIKSLSWDPPDTSIFDNSTDTAAVQGSYFLTPQPPLTNPQSMLFEERLHAVEPSYKVGPPPSYTTFEAYLAMTYIYEGLQLTGSANPTQAEFIKHMLTVKNWTDNGLLPGPIGLDHFGTSDSKYCSWFTKVEGTKFVYVNNDKPFCATVPSNL